MMHVAIVAATAKEIEQLTADVSLLRSKKEISFDVSLHITGVGLLASAFSIGQLLHGQRPGLVLQAGIAGSLLPDMELGTVLTVSDEYIGDLGVVENGTFLDLFELQLLHADDHPFTGRSLVNPHLTDWNLTNLPPVGAVSVNEITTNPKRIIHLQQKYRAVLESMEGAALHYCCLQHHIPFLQIRAASNHVGERDKTRWAFREAFANLSQAVITYLRTLEQHLKTHSQIVSP